MKMRIALAMLLSLVTFFSAECKSKMSYGRGFADGFDVSSKKGEAYWKGFAEGSEVVMHNMIKRLNKSCSEYGDKGACESALVYVKKNNNFDQVEKVCAEMGDEYGKYCTKLKKSKEGLEEAVNLYTNKLKHMNYCGVDIPNIRTKL